MKILVASNLIHRLAHKNFIYMDFLVVSVWYSQVDKVIIWQHYTLQNLCKISEIQLSQFVSCIVLIAASRKYIADITDELNILLSMRYANTIMRLV